APGHLLWNDQAGTPLPNNIEFITLPKNSTLVTQPLDAGIIAVFKRFYNNFLAVSTLAHLQ
ncbi:hypothetical protein BGZ52_012291, partial [Haplosporangium bisporale]